MVSLLHRATINKVKRLHYFCSKFRYYQHIYSDCWVFALIIICCYVTASHSPNPYFTICTKCFSQKCVFFCMRYKCPLEGLKFQQCDNISDNCLSNALDRPSNQFFPSVSQSVSQSVCLLTDRLSNDYVHNSLPIFTKFCMRLTNVVASSPIVCERNRK